MVTRLLFENELEQVNPTSLLGVLPPNLQQMSVREKAAVYNQLVNQGFSSQQIRDIVEVELGPQSNANWGALQDIASSIRGTPFQQGGILESQFGDAGSWNFGAGSEYQNNMIVAPNAYFQRGGDVVVSDELFWNPNSPTGDALKQKVDQTKAAGNRAGVVITPYAVFQGKASNQQLINEIKNSGVDFVALDPYFGFGVSKDELLNWTKDFIPQLNDLGLGVKLVTQGFAKAGLEQETRQYNEQLRSLPGVSEFVEFGLEDAPDLQGSPEWVSLSAQQDTAQATQPSTQGQSAASTAIEQQATMQTPQGAAAQPEGLLSGQAAQSQANRLDLQSLVTPEDAANIRSAYEIGAAYPIVRGNEVYSFNPDGSIEYTRMNPSGIGATIGLYSSTGEEIVPQYYNADFGKTSNATRLLQAGLAAGIGGILGPAGAGLLSAPLAAATGAGLTSYGVTGDLESALKSAALGGLTAFGIETLFPTAAQTAANTAVDLAGAGASQADIVNALVEQGVRTGTASQIASDALAGATARQIATDFAGISVGGAGAASSGLPNVVTITGGANPASLLATAAPSAAGAISGGLLGSAAQPTSPNLLADTQSVTVQGATAPAQATAPGAAAVGAITPSQSVQVQATSQQLTPDQASTIVSALAGQPVSVAGQQVQVTGQTAQQISPDAAAALISAAVGQQVTVAGQTISQPADSSLGAAAGSLLQTVPVQSTTLPAQQQISAPTGAAAGSLVSQLVPVQATTLPAQTQTAAPAGAAVGGLLQTVPVQSTTIPAQTNAAAPTGAAVGGLLSQTVPVQSTTIPAQTQATTPISAAVGTLAPTQAVTIEDRPIRREEAQILTPVLTGTVAGVPVADVTVPRSSTGQIEGSTTVNPLVAAGLLGLGATTLTGGQGQANQFDQAAFDAILNAGRPVYPRGDFVPGVGFGMLNTMPGAYDYFGPYYGAGRFGARPRPFMLPGLLGPMTGTMSTPITPSRGSSI
jgi:hypothetical protein